MVEQQHVYHCLGSSPQDAATSAINTEKKIASNKISEILILIGTLVQLKTGMTMKNAESRVTTIIKPSSFSVISGIDQCPML